MAKQVLLLTDANISPSFELIESLRSAGIAVANEYLNENGLEVGHSRHSALLYEIRSETSIERLSSVVERASSAWPGVPIVACRLYPTKSKARTAAALDNETLKRLGFRAIADSPTQLPALLRQLEDVPSTGELKPFPDFHSAPSSTVFSLPATMRGKQLRGAFALTASLHLAKNQKEAGQIALAGVARLVPADRWSIFLVTHTNTPDSITVEPLVSRRFSPDARLTFDDDWQREWFESTEALDELHSKITHEAATRVETLARTEGCQYLVALPLVTADIVSGVLQGLRDHDDAQTFSHSEIELLVALAIPIGSALTNSLRISDAERLSHTDDLTKLHNARYLRQFLVNEVKRARRYHSNVATLFLDLDDFKRVNDMHGHLVGSHALMEIASVILPSVRDTDCVVRYGGDEFVIILPETGIDEALQVAERIRLKLERHPFTGGRRLKLSLTTSFGIAVFPQHALSPQQLVTCADTAMYEAKAGGKNCVRISTNPSAIDEGANSSLLLPKPFLKFPDEKLIS